MPTSIDSGNNNVVEITDDKARNLLLIAFSKDFVIEFDTSANEIVIT
jgi:hypothetical protein